METIVVSVILLVFLCIGIYLIIKFEKFNWKCLITFYGFIFLSTLVITGKYQYFKFAYGKWFVEFREKFEQIGDEFLNKLNEDIQKQRESIELLISTANQTKNELERQKNELQSLITVAETLKNDIEAQKQTVSQLNQETNKTKKEIANLNKASEEIILTLVRNMQKELGYERTNESIHASQKDIERIMQIMEIDPNSREKIIERVKKELASGNSSLSP